MVDRYMRTDSSRCDPSRITLDLRSPVIQLGSQLKESFITHLPTIRFSLNKQSQKDVINIYYKVDASKHLYY